MIVASAIKFKIESTNKEVILCGLRHSDIFNQLVCLGFEPKKGYKEIEQGFITDNNEFLNRKESYKHAFRCNQLPGSVIFNNHNTGELYSEDLWR